ncbi:ABC-2 type transport system permease protein [Streptomonospora nanhaiensis]|uniref:ABC-2 type transport system permease protein n=1 Tax=Streptomonospora nanhaiensis TaxID=1323731 RepID=A0A853BXI9_9ACTN|nr:ABC-2 type transport system permease protein [Streptomonospora nanhaiensis]
MTAAAGAARLALAALRRDRVLLAVWWLSTVGIVLGGTASARSTYPTAAARADRWEQLQQVPVFVLFQSRAFADTAEALAAQQAFGAGTMCAALGGILLVVRATRLEENSGRRELLGGLPLGRHADLAAALAVALGAGAAVAAAVAAGLVAAGAPPAGSVVLGLVTGSAAWVGAGLTAVAVQFTTRTGVAVGLAFGAFYAMHLVRGLGAMAGGSALWATWAVPNGWLENARPFAGDQWWALLLVPVWTAAVAAAALALAGRRDLGAGLLPPGSGPARAHRALRSAFALALRAERTSLALWAGAVAVAGLAMGGVGAGAMAEYATAPWTLAMAEALNIAPRDAFFVYVVFAFVFPIAAQAVLAVLRVRREESSGTGELLLSGPVGRVRWALAYLAVALLCPAVLLAVLGVAVGTGQALGGEGEAADVLRFTGLTLSLVPAVWVVVAAAFLAFGALPRLCAAVGWAALAVGVLVEIAVKTGTVPEALFLLTSPFAHVNPYYRTTEAAPLLLAALAAALAALGAWALRHRDLPA